MPESRLKYYENGEWLVEPYYSDDFVYARGASVQEIAEELKDSLFTLGWTEEAIGSDLLSMTTAATPKTFFIIIRSPVPRPHGIERASEGSRRRMAWTVSETL
ncbi:MAG: hypothetical protein HC782_04490 [Gammaproteobacteria bacterium]|nr:hypothetical protein [Gammaproteobacteria bacterium]